jgi:hypothetical protein
MRKNRPRLRGNGSSVSVTKRVTCHRTSHATVTYKRTEDRGQILQNLKVLQGEGANAPHAPGRLRFLWCL